MFTNVLVYAIILFIIFVPIISPIWIFDTDFYLDQKGNKIIRQKQPILRFLVKQLIGIVQEIIIGFAVALSLKGAITILIFLVIGSDLYFTKSLSSNSVIITIVGVIALYMEQLVANASEIDFKIFKYNSK